MLDIIEQVHSTESPPVSSLATPIASDSLPATDTTVQYYQALVDEDKFDIDGWDTDEVPWDQLDIEEDDEAE